MQWSNEEGQRTTKDWASFDNTNPVLEIIVGSPRLIPYRYSPLTIRVSERHQPWVIDDCLTHVRAYSDNRLLILVTSTDTDIAEKKAHCVQIQEYINTIYMKCTNFQPISKFNFESYWQKTVLLCMW